MENTYPVQCCGYSVFCFAADGKHWEGFVICGQYSSVYLNILTVLGFKIKDDARWV